MASDKELEAIGGLRPDCFLVHGTRRAGRPSSSWVNSVLVIGYQRALGSRCTYLVTGFSEPQERGKPLRKGEKAESRSTARSRPAVNSLEHARTRTKCTRSPLADLVGSVRVPASILASRTSAIRGLHVVCRRDRHGIQCLGCFLMLTNAYLETREGLTHGVRRLEGRRKLAFLHFFLYASDSLRQWASGTSSENEPCKSLWITQVGSRMLHWASLRKSNRGLHSASTVCPGSAGSTSVAAPPPAQVTAETAHTSSESSPDTVAHSCVESESLEAESDGEDRRCL